jgi:hypothetical protein
MQHFLVAYDICNYIKKITKDNFSFNEFDQHKFAIVRKKEEVLFKENLPRHLQSQC